MAALKTVLIFTKINIKRFFRDRLAIFFAVLFPLIFLIVFGFLVNGNNNISFNVAIINHSSSLASRQFITGLKSNKVFKINQTVQSLTVAQHDMIYNKIDATIVLNKDFGQIKNHIPTGKVKVLYTENSSLAAQTISSLINSTVVKNLNNHLVKSSKPFIVLPQKLNYHSLTTFDYTFAGILGFSIIGIGIFSQIEIFPELKKQGVLRRLHTTPIKVWQYFLATMLSQALIGIIAIAIQFVAAVLFFNLQINGNLLEILIFTVFSIFMILGIGLAIGGWAKNERQAAPLANIIIFPMLFLSGTFFPQFEMPIWLQRISSFLPLTPVINGLRLLTTAGKNLTQIGPEIGLIFVWFVIIYAIAFRVFNWE